MFKVTGIMFLLSVCCLMTTSCKKDIMQIETGRVTDVLSTTVYISGYINSAGEGIKRYGHCISPDPDPCLSDITSEFSSTIGTGEFTSVIYNLQPGTQYFARGYITSGNVVIYGKEISFLTGELQSNQDQ